LTIKQQAKDILLSDYKFRKYPKEAQIEFMRRNGLILTEEQKRAYMDMPDTWNFRRQCQRLVHDGEVKIEEEIDEYRFERYREETIRHSPKTAEEIASMQGYRLVD
jgi:RecB family exonuclease